MIRVPVLRRRCAVSLVAAGLLLAAHAAAAAPLCAQDGDGGEVSADGEPMSLVDRLEVPILEDPRLSPDGSRVVFVRGEADWEEDRLVHHLWLVETPEPRQEPRGAKQLTTGGEGETSPRWSPDSDRIAFLAERGDDEHAQIHVIPTSGGEARRLTDHPTAVSDIRWAPDGQHLYFLAEDEETEARKAREEAGNDVYAVDEDWRHRHLWRVSVPDGEAERVTGGDFSIWDYRISRDGSMLVVHRGPTPLFDDWGETEVWVADASGAGMRRVTDNGVPESGARLSPDNRRVLFLSMANADLEFYYQSNLFTAPVPAGGEPPSGLRLEAPDLPHEVTAAEWSRDGSRIYFLANTGVRQDLFWLQPERGEVVRVTEGDHTVEDWQYRPALGRHVFRIATPRSPGEVHTVQTATPARGRREPVRVTRVYEGLVERYRLPEQEVVAWEGEDGTEVEGVLFHPLDRREGERAPLVVQTHGGPTASDKIGFGSAWDYPQVLAARGWFVLQPNYRGSTGYGDAFMRDMVGHYFRHAHRDVMAGVDALVERGLVDEDRMVKMGWSAGGHMTNKIITHTDRFAAASSGAGASNWISMYGQSDIRFYRTPWFGGSPWGKDAPVETYWSHSPLSDVHRVSTPTIFLVGEEDERVPMPQSVEMYRALDHHGVPTHLYVAPGAAHGWEKLRHRLFKGNVELDWFTRHALGEEYTWETAPGDDEEESIRSAEDVHR